MTRERVSGCSRRPRHLACDGSSPSDPVRGASVDIGGALAGLSGTFTSQGAQSAIRDPPKA
eukprot:15468491-Alexandrium_andersonii.AAC.1